MKEKYYLRYEGKEYFFSTMQEGLDKMKELGLSPSDFQTTNIKR